LADLVGLADHVQAEDLGPPAVRRKDGGEDADGGGLAGAVGAEEPEHGARRDREVDAVEGDHVAEAFGQALHQDGAVAHDRRWWHDTSRSDKRGRGKAAIAAEARGALPDGVPPHRPRA
jgi:hypothetical protein